MTQAATRLLAVPGGVVEYLTVGTGLPRTLFVHGLAGGIADTRVLAGGVPGTRAFAHLGGHGATRVAGARPGYAGLADQLAAVAAHVSADRALGVSLGAAALLRLLAEERRAGRPARFERLALFLPAALDRPSSVTAVTRHQELAARIEARDVGAVADALIRTQPSRVRAVPAARAWADEHARDLVATADPAAWPSYAAEAPVTDPSILAGLDLAVLVIAQQDDEAHPVAVAERIAAVLPNARLRVFDASGALWGHRAELRMLLADFLGPSDPAGGR